MSTGTWTREQQVEFDIKAGVRDANGIVYDAPAWSGDVRTLTDEQLIARAGSLARSIAFETYDVDFDREPGSRYIPRVTPRAITGDLVAKYVAVLNEEGRRWDS